MTRALVRTAATGLIVGMGLLGGAASAQTDELVITEPATQTVVTQGDTVPVRGTGCEPGSEVLFTSGDDTLGRTTAADDGSFDGQLTTPVWGEAEDVEEPYELGVTVTCGDATGGFVLVNRPAEAADDDGAGGPTEEQLAYTGTETDLAVAGVAAVLGGALLLAGSSRARRRADAGGAGGASRA